MGKKQHVARVDLYDDHVDITIRLAALAPGVDRDHVLSAPVERVRRKHEIKLVFPASDPAPASCDPRLIAPVAEAHAVRRAVREQTGSLSQIAARLGRCRGHLADMMRVSYLAPDIVTAILEGRHPESLNRKTLVATDLSLDWNEQRSQLGFT